MYISCIECHSEWTEPADLSVCPWPAPQSVKGIAILGSGTISNLKCYNHAVAHTCCLVQWIGVRCPWHLRQAFYNVFLFLHGNKINLSWRAEGVPNLKLRRPIFRLFSANKKRKTLDWHYTSVCSSSREEFPSTLCKVLLATKWYEYPGCMTSNCGTTVNVEAWPILRYCPNVYLQELK